MSIRRIALDALIDITDNKAYANLRLNEARARCQDMRDGAFVSALVYTTLDSLVTIDYYLESFVRGRQKPIIRAILRMGAAQILYMRTPAHAACDASVKLTKEVGKAALSGFVNGVLRALSRANDANALPKIPEKPTKTRLHLTYGWPMWLIETWIADYGEDFTEAFISSPQTNSLALRAQHPYTTGELKAHLDSEHIAYDEGKILKDCLHVTGDFSIQDSELFASGKISVQGESAMIACLALGDINGKRILDACAAPGGKSAYMASLSQNTAVITAWEKHPHRKQLLDKTLERLHVNAVTEVCDAKEHQAKYDGAFDIVLVDVPCSGFGVAGSKPDLRYSKTEEGIESLVSEQAAILDTVSAYVKEGGALVYVTCTVNQRENDERITKFLSEHDEFEADDLGCNLPSSIAGIEGCALQLFPHIHGVEGFYIARLKRRG